VKINPAKSNDIKALYEKLYLNRLPKFFFGGFWIRTAAYSIDLLIIQFLTSILLNLVVYRLFGMGASDSFGVEIVDLAVFLAYFFLTTYFMNGQTLGKMLLRLRVVSLTESQSTLSTILIREVAGKTIFYYFPFIAVLLVFSFKRQHVVDLLADTTVMNEGKLLEFNWFAGKVYRST